MILRSAIGFSALLAYAWRVHDPVGSYTAFFKVSDVLTGLFLSEAGISGVLRNIVSLVLIDQADGFLVGIAVATILSSILALGRRTLCLLARTGWRCLRSTLRPRRRSAIAA